MGKLALQSVDMAFWTVKHAGQGSRLSNWMLYPSGSMKPPAFWKQELSKESTTRFSSGGSMTADHHRWPLSSSTFRSWTRGKQLGKTPSATVVARGGPRFSTLLGRHAWMF